MDELQGPGLQLCVCVCRCCVVVIRLDEHGISFERTAQEVKSH
jgi:hypothetical protein